MPVKEGREFPRRQLQEVRRKVQVEAAKGGVINRVTKKNKKVDFYLCAEEVKRLYTAKEDHLRSETPGG